MRIEVGIQEKLVKAISLLTGLSYKQLGENFGIDIDERLVDAADVRIPKRSTVEKRRGRTLKAQRSKTTRPVIEESCRYVEENYDKLEGRLRTLAKRYLGRRGEMFVDDVIQDILFYLCKTKNPEKANLNWLVFRRVSNMHYDGYIEESLRTRDFLETQVMERPDELYEGCTDLVDSEKHEDNDKPRNPTIALMEFLEKLVGEKTAGSVLRMRQYRYNQMKHNFQTLEID